MATWREALTLAETRRAEREKERGGTADEEEMGDEVENSSGLRLRFCLYAETLRGPWAVGRAVVLVQFCVIQLELIEPARCWGDYIIRYSICVAKKKYLAASHEKCFSAGRACS